MNAIGQYDPDLEMYCEEHPINYDRLLFVRWLIEHNRLYTHRVDDESAPTLHLGETCSLKA